MGWFLGQSATGAVVSSRFSERLDGVTVADVMDTQPVWVPGDTTVLQAQDEFFLRYRWPWFPVVDATPDASWAWSAGRRSRTPEALRPGSSVDQVIPTENAGSYRIGVDEPLRDAARLGGPCPSRRALMAVDPDGVLRGIVTLNQVRRALQAPVGLP